VKHTMCHGHLRGNNMTDILTSNSNWQAIISELKESLECATDELATVSRDTKNWRKWDAMVVALGTAIEVLQANDCMDTEIADAPEHIMAQCFICGRTIEQHTKVCDSCAEENERWWRVQREFEK
jgi:hypothetical protein